MEEIIKTAIANKQKLIIDYKNEGSRIVEPHCYGKSKTDKEMLSGYQLTGASESNMHEGWKQFLLANITSLEITSQNFSEPRPGYNPNDSNMIQIFARI